MKISKKLIINEAYEVKKFFDKNKKLPKYATISNSQFTPPQYSYVFAKLVGKMSLPTVNKCSVGCLVRYWNRPRTQRLAKSTISLKSMV